MAQLLRGGDVDEIRAMHQQGLSITDIAGFTGFDRKTVRKWLRQAGPPRYGPRSPPDDRSHTDIPERSCR